jgi:hypothetical protein
MNRGLVVTMLLLAGCATVRTHEATSIEQLLAAAGFQMRPADTPERLAALHAMPRQRLIAQSNDGAVTYTFADPDGCRCIYVGGPKEYSAYERFLVEKKLTDVKARAAMESAWWGPPYGGW